MLCKAAGTPIELPEGRCLLFVLLCSSPLLPIFPKCAETQQPFAAEVKSGKTTEAMIRVRHIILLLVGRFGSVAVTGCLPSFLRAAQSSLLPTGVNG